MSRFLFSGVLLLVAAGLIYGLSNTLLPFLVGILAAYLLDPISTRLARHGVPRSLSAALPALLFFGGLGLFIFLALPALARQVVGFSRGLPTSLRQFEQQAQPLLDKYLPTDINPKALATQISGYAGEAFSLLIGTVESLAAASQVIFNTASLFVVTPLVVFYLIRDWQPFVDGCLSLVPKKYHKTLKTLLARADVALASYFRGQFLVALCLAVFYGTGLALAGLHLGVFIGFMAGLLSFIPFVGMFLGVVAALFTALVQFQFSGWEPYLIIGAIFVAGQILEGVFLQPRLIGEKAGLHPLWVIFAVMAGGELAGFWGVVAALPLATMLAALLPDALAFCKKRLS